MDDVPTMKPSDLHKIIEDYMRDMRNLWDKTLCTHCQGWGIKSYPNTATWHRGSGIAGQAFTDDVCDECWGSGDANQPWPTHRK